MLEFEAERFAMLRSTEELPAESVADLVKVGVPQSTEELLVESGVDLETFALLGSPEMLLAESEAEVVKVASMRLLEELVVLLLGTGLELQAAVPAVAAVRSERQYLPEFLLEATLEADLVRFVAAPAAVVAEPYSRLVAAGVEMGPEVDIGFVGEVSCLVGLVVEGIDYMCEDIYSAIPGHLGKKPVWDCTHLIGP